MLERVKDVYTIAYFMAGAVIRTVVIMLLRPVLSRFGSTWDENNWSPSAVRGILGSSKDPVRAEVVPAEAMLGYAASHCLLNVEWTKEDAHLPSKYFIKRAKPTFMGFLASSAGTLCREASFYAEIVPRWAEVIQTPKVVMSRNLLSCEMQIVSEFVQEVDRGPDATAWPDDASPDEDALHEPYIDARLQVLARFQAWAWGEKSHRLLEEFPYLSPSSVLTPGPAMFRLAHAAFLKRYAHVLPSAWREEGVAKVMLRIAETVEMRLKRLYSGKFQTLTHGDFRANNLLHLCGQLPLVLDWSCVHVSSATTDLAYLLCLDMPVRYRRQHEAQIMARHLELLKEQGVDVDPESFQEELQNAFIYPFMLAVNATSMIDQNLAPEEKRQWDEWIRRLSHGIHDHGV